MAKVEYKVGYECKCCGNIVCNLANYDILCQKCGAKVMAGYSINSGWQLTENAQSISVKITHKLFSKKYEKVRNI